MQKGSGHTTKIVGTMAPSVTMCDYQLHHTFCDYLYWINKVQLLYMISWPHIDKYTFKLFTLE